MGHDVFFEFEGFDPGYEIKNFVSSIAEKLHLSAPSDSALKFVLRKSKGAVRASCKIASQAGTFVAEAMSDNPIHAVTKVEKKIRQQLEQWLRSRFE